MTMRRWNSTHFSDQLGLCAECFELLKSSAHLKILIQKFSFLFNLNWLMAGQPVYLLNA